jgi:ADP-ribose pyrophosphatase
MRLEYKAGHRGLQSMDTGQKVVVRGKRRVFDGFFKLDEVTVSHRQFDGAMSPDQTFLIFERGDAVATLIYNRDTARVVLVEQFKMPTLDKSATGGWIVEVAAGMIKDGETPEQAVVREALEETGFQISEPEHIATFFSSPGGSTERIFLYYAVVTEADRAGSGGGNRQEGEDIRNVEITPSELFERLRLKQIDDPKLVIAAYHLKDRLKVDPPKPQPLKAGTIQFRNRSTPGPVIGIKTGAILAVRDVDVWVNSENTDMMMDRVIGRTISANIRYGGAEKDEAGNIYEDTIADDLRKRLGRRGYVRLGTVIETVPGALRDKGVKRIMHVAGVQGAGPGMGVRADPAMVEMCVARVLEAAERRSSGFRLMSRRDRSILIPMIGCGDGGLAVEEAAAHIVSAVHAFSQQHPAPTLSEIYLLAYTKRDLVSCEKEILALDGFERIVE